MGGDYSKLVTKVEDVRAAVTAESISNSMTGLIQAAIEMAANPTAYNQRVLKRWINDAAGENIFDMDEDAPPDVVSPG